MDNANQPAFPTPDKRDSENKLVYSGESGLTKREYIAALLCQGMLANGHAGSFEVISKSAVHGADSLLKRLEENKIS